MKNAKRDGDYIVLSDGTVFKKMDGNVNSQGYRRVWYQGRSEFVHRIVAKLFLNNPEDLPCINHKDGDKLNNNLDNLEWCSYTHNNKHAIDTGLRRLRPVICMKGGRKERFDNIANAADVLGLHAGNISRALNGLRKTAGGYTWSYEDKKSKERLERND